MVLVVMAEFMLYSLIELSIQDNRKTVMCLIFAYLLSVHDTISLSRHEQVCLIRLHFERYFSHHRAT